MIYTVTLNPALDYVVRFEQFIMGDLNRSISEELYCGGKGINVSVVLTELDVPNIALGFISGFTGEAIRNEIKRKGVMEDFIQLDAGFSRINVKIKTDKETEINGQGPDIDENSLKRFYDKLAMLRDGDILILAGSVPKCLSEDIYEQIMCKLQDIKVSFIVDTTGKCLLDILKYKPFLIKPNKAELEELFHKKINEDNDIVKYAKDLKKRGAQNVLVSLGSKGAILVDAAGTVHNMGVFKGKVVNSVGAGDSMVAGFLYGWLKSGKYDYALKCGTAAGCATAFSRDIATKDKIITLINQE